MSDIKEVFDRAIEDGVMTRAEHEAFIEMIHKDGVIDEEESQQIARLFLLIQAGKLQIVDEDREAFADKRKAEAIKKANR